MPRWPTTRLTGPVPHGAKATRVPAGPAARSRTGSAIVLASDGTPKALVIDVGGFPSIGGKLVAFPAPDIEIHLSHADNDVRVAVLMTEGELEGMPGYAGCGPAHRRGPPRSARLPLPAEMRAGVPKLGGPR